MSRFEKIWASFDGKRAVQCLREMTEIPSLSNEEDEIASYVEKRLQSSGYETQRQRVIEGSSNVIALKRGRKDGLRVMLAGHLDTVPPTAGWETDPFTLVEDGERLYGLGTADMKAGLGVILTLADLLKEEELEGDLLLLFVADEEGKSKGIKRFLEENQERVDVAFMLEPHFSAATLGANGKMLIEVDVQGRAAHGAYYKEGINAIEEASIFIGEMIKLDLIDSKGELKPQPYIPLSFKGGYEKYSITIPDHAVFTINKHTVLGETCEHVLKELDDLKNRLELKGDFSFEVIDPFYPPYDVPKNNPYFQQLKEIYRDLTERELGIAYGTGVSDANILVETGNIPTISFGPSGGAIHAINEWVSKEEYFKVIEIYLKLLTDLL